MSAVVVWLRRLGATLPWSFWAPFGVLLLLPFGRSSEFALLVCAVVGIVVAVRRPAWLGTQPAVRLALLLWLAYFVAALVSAFDSVAPGKSWTTVAGLLRFAPFAVGMLVLLRGERALARLYAAIAVLVGLWLVDAWVQIFTGLSLGGMNTADRLSGIFGAGDLKLGPVLAVLSPFVLLGARRVAGGRGELLAGVVLLGPILLAGSRAAWLMFALVVLALVYRQAGSWRRRGLWAAGVAVAIAVGAGVAWHTSPHFEARVERTAQFTKLTPAAWNTALAGRLSIWGTSAGMIGAHRVNGVGVRAFRFAYPKYAAPGDRFVAMHHGREGAFYAHQWVLEVLSETGGIGLLLWCAGIALAVRTWWRAATVARQRAFPVTLALAVMLFPLNTHYAFYSAWWGLLFWWLLALWAAAISAREAGIGDPGSGIREPVSGDRQVTIR